MQGFVGADHVYPHGPPNCAATRVYARLRRAPVTRSASRSLLALFPLRSHHVCSRPAGLTRVETPFDICDQFDPLNPPHPSASAHRSLAVELKTQQMLASAHSLLSLAHTLKLLHLFGDEAAVVQAQERASRQLEADIERLKARLDELAGLDDNAAA